LLLPSDRESFTVAFDVHSHPNAGEVGCALGEEFYTCGKDGRRERVAIHTRRGVRHGDDVGKEVMI
jgi:hypothetical protein